MKTVFLAAMLILSPALAKAQTQTIPAPVKEIMDVTIKAWSGAETTGEPEDLFSADRLKRLYSRDFGAKYTAASKFPAYDTENGGPGSPFDHDVITSSQDGCPLEDVTMKSNGAVAGAEEIAVKFRLMGCSEDPVYKAAVSEVRFRVIKEEGRDVVDDIMTQGEGEASFESLKKSMIEIAAQ
jgi:hypothetical protein